MSDRPVIQCPVIHHGVNGELRCTYPVGHEMAHAHYRGLHLVAAWLTPAEAAAARARGEYDDSPVCSCAEPEPVCAECGGEVVL